MLKTVILAAGMGTRLGSLIPKPLSALENEKVILDYQLQSLIELVGVNNIFIVVGYKKELIMERYPQLTYIYNNRYIHTNTSKSLLMALEKIDDDVIWLNGDVFFDKEVIELLINSRNSCCLVDNKSCGQEEIKYNCHEDGYIKNISKEVSDGIGEALGINLILKSDLSLFKTELNRVSDNAYFEKALENLTLEKKLRLLPVNKEGYFCQEIDFQEDLQEVLEYLSINKR